MYVLQNASFLATRGDIPQHSSVCYRFRTEFLIGGSSTLYIYIYINIYIYIYAIYYEILVSSIIKHVDFFLEN